MTQPLRIVITGASGFLGRQIVPRLRAAGVDILLAGRDPEGLTAQFPEIPATCGYADLADRAAGYDALLHLAVRNNDQPGTRGDFFAANVDLLRDTAQAAQHAGIRTFINTSSLQADPDSKNPYAASKAAGEKVLADIEELRVVTLRLPAVYGDGFKGVLGVLNKVPGFIRPLAFRVLSSLKPTAHVDRVAEAVLDHAGAPAETGSVEAIVSDKQIGNWVYAGLIRALDLIFVLIIALGFFWLLGIVWIAVKVTSPGPGFFAQTRVGRDEKLFTCYKFRTMKTGTLQRGTHEIGESAVTRVGHFLRKTKVDELPQIVNILRNEITLVGPRPCLPNQEELIAQRRKRRVFAVKAGITGLGQVQGIDMGTPERLAKVDAEYIARRSVLFDLKILIRTALGGGQGDRTKKD